MEDTNMFEGIGRMGDYLKQRDLKLQAKYKMKTGQSLDALKEQLRKNNTFEARTIRAQKTRMTDDTKVSIIRQKLRAGRELSAAELTYLKKNDPDLYAKAREAQETRTELQQALKRAKTKAEAIRAVAQIQAKVATAAALEAKYGSTSGAMANAAAGAGMSAPAEGGASSMADTASSAASFATETAEQAAGVGTMTAPSNGTLTGSEQATGMAGIADDSSIGKAEVKASGAEAAAGAKASTADTSPAKGASLEAREDTSTGQTDVGKTATDRAEKETAAKEQTLADAVELANTKKALMESYLSTDKSAALPLEKYIFMLAAINDEWAKFANSKDYEELPDDYLSMEGAETHSTKKPYRPTGMANVEAAERYKVADSLLADDTTGSLLDLVSKLG